MDLIKEIAKEDGIVITELNREYWIEEVDDYYGNEDPVEKVAKKYNLKKTGCRIILKK